MPFPDANYGIFWGPPNAPVVINADGTTKTNTGITLRSSGEYNGSIPVVAWEAGVSPFNLWSATSTGVLQSIIRNFRSNARCTGVYALQAGRMWDYPVGATWDGYGGAWDAPSVVSQIIGGF